jgi:cobyrinic acid a,c-diamide synthase
MSLTLPERHLGLVTAAEGGYTSALGQRLAELIEASVDLESLIGAARSRVERTSIPDSRRSFRAEPIATIAVARDEAFQFYYAENLEMLSEAGARLVFWSPLRDDSLPDADGIYIGGGYPELHGRALSANHALLHDVRAFAESGRPIYAECGGLMYLARSLTDADGAAWPMAGLLPAAVHMERTGLTIGYREVETTTESPLGPVGTRARGHEFHCSTLEPVPDAVARAYAMTGAPGAATRLEGYVVGRALMSYVHLHFGSNPSVARHFVSTCARRR